MNNTLVDENWISQFYSEMNPEKRQELLNLNCPKPQGAEDELRWQLWIARYGKRKPRSDAFVGYLMNLKYIAESGAADIGGKKKKLALETIHGMYLYEYDRRPEALQDIIYRELKNTCLKYIDISAGGRGFTSVIFGMGQLTDESVAKKIAEQLSAVLFDAPHILHMDKEFSALQKAGTDAFREAYPNREHFLRKR